MVTGIGACRSQQPRHSGHHDDPPGVALTLVWSGSRRARVHHRHLDRHGGRLEAGGLIDGVLPPVFVVTSALPYFWVALLFISLFAIGDHPLLPNDFNYDQGCTPASPARSSPA